MRKRERSECHLQKAMKELNMPLKKGGDDRITKHHDTLWGIIKFIYEPSAVIRVAREPGSKRACYSIAQLCERKSPVSSSSHGCQIALSHSASGPLEQNDLLN